MDSIDRHSLHDELLSRLRQMIVSGQFQPGEKIPERQLCGQFGVSRTPLREALKVLAAEGLVQLAPNRGAMVAELTAETLEECLPMAAAIESLTGELACQTITEEEIEAIRACHAKMSAEHKAGNVEGYLAMTGQIHGAILAAARNPLLSELYDTLFFRVGRSRLAPYIEKQALSQDLADHEEILSALEARQCQRLAGLLQRQMQHLFGVYRRALSAAPAHVESTVQA